MRVLSIVVKDALPIKNFSVDSLADVVVLAGPNGVGKTRLIQTVMQKFQQLEQMPGVRLVLAATSPDERRSWGKSQLDTVEPSDAKLLKTTLTMARRRTNWVSSVVHIESDRSIEKIEPFTFTWDIPDPWEEKVAWTSTFGGLRGRFQDTLHSLLRKVQNHRNHIAATAEAHMREGKTSMSLDFPDPLEPFKDAFSQLLGPKVLLDPDLRTQQLRYRIDGQAFDINRLSSGERQVVNIAFDLILRSPSDSVIIFDEPELHLHPELSYRLLRTLRSIGERNQFVLCTHSPDIITASLDQSVVFVSPPREHVDNQAVVVREGDETYEALRLLGQSVGVVSLGKKIVIVEGTDASLDKQLYGTILRDRCPDLVLVPAGDKSGIAGFAKIATAILRKTIWGVDFFVLCDRDAVPHNRSSEQLEVETAGRLRVLKRYHLENYLLDEDVIAAAFRAFEPEGSWLTSPVQIREELRQLARTLLSYSTALIVSATIREAVGNVDVMPRDCHNRTVADLSNLFAERLRSETDRAAAALDAAFASDLVEQTYHRLEESLDKDSNDWKVDMPGKPLLGKFAAKTQINSARLKTMIVKQMLRTQNPAIDELLNIFESFRSAT